MFESNLNSFLDMLFKETHPILSIFFIWKKNTKTSTLGWMLKKGHKISKALTIAILFGAPLIVQFLILVLGSVVLLYVSLRVQ